VSTCTSGWPSDEVDSPHELVGEIPKGHETGDGEGKANNVQEI
jgi:hypothetical protein